MANPSDQGRVLLHDEIKDILAERGEGMTDDEIARRVNERDRYHKGDGSEVKPDQIRLRTSENTSGGKYAHMFERRDGLVFLRDKS